MTVTIEVGAIVIDGDRWVMLFYADECSIWCGDWGARVTVGLA